MSFEFNQFFSSIYTTPLFPFTLLLLLNAAQHIEITKNKYYVDFLLFVCSQ